MNAPVNPDSVGAGLNREHRAGASAPAPDTVPQDHGGNSEELPWRTNVSRLIATTSLVSPGLIVGSGWLMDGAGGATVAMLPAVLIGAGLMWNDHAVVREVMAGGGARLTLILRALVPIGVSSLASVPILMAWCGNDIDVQKADMERAVIAPITEFVARTVDISNGDLEKAASVAEAERRGLRGELAELVARDAAEESEIRRRLRDAEDQVRHQQYVLDCEKDGSRCLATSSGRPGENGAVSNPARHLQNDAIRRAAAARQDLADLPSRRESQIARINQRLAVLEGAAASDTSVAAVQSRLAAARASRDALVARRVDAHPDVVAIRTPWGPAQRLVALFKFLFANPVLFTLVLAGKTVQTAFELSGVLRAVRYARLSHEGRWWRAAQQTRDHSARLIAVERETEHSLKKIDAKQTLWRAKRQSADVRLLDLVDGVRMLVLKHMLGRS
jgi:hypothetical protein